MARFPAFAGPSNTQASQAVDDSGTINLILRQVETGAPVSNPAHYMRPCLQPYASLGAGPVRATFAQDGRAFAVGGGNLYEVLPSRTAVLRGSGLRVNGNPATISSSGAQGNELFIVSGGELYLFELSTNTFSLVTSTTVPEECVMGLFWKTYFWGLSGADGRVQWSKQYDGAVWNRLNFAIVSDFSDKIVSFTRTHDSLWLFGTRNTQPWVFTGSGNQTIEPQPGALIEHGIAGPFTAIELDNTVYWLGRDEQGTAMVWRANGYTPVRVSTHAVEAALAKVSDYSQAVAWSYQEQGSTCYVLYVPGLETTWVYEIGTNSWVEWGHWNTTTGRYVPYRGVNHAFAFGTHLVGDRLGRIVYEQRLGDPLIAPDFYADDLEVA